MKKIILFSTLANLLIFANPYCYCQNVGINGFGSTPNSSALLDVDATGMTPQKGLLIPRVPLTSTTDAATITTPATSLMVYNTATAGTSPNNVVPGYYYNAGTSGSPNWMMFQASNANSGGCGSIQTFTSSGTWTKPACGGVAYIRCWGGGGGGNSVNGYGGGGGGGYNETWIAISSLGASETVTIGAGGSVGNPATGGGNTTFGAWLTAYGGGGSGNTGVGGGGGGTTGAGTNTGTAGNPQLIDGSGYYQGQGGVVITSVFHGGGGGGAEGGNSLYGGGGGGGSNFSGACGGVSCGGKSVFGGAGGANGVAGTAPGGGGGRNAAGAAGKCIIIVY